MTVQNIAIASILIPFIGALFTACAPYRVAKLLGVLFSLLATLCVIALGYVFLSNGKISEVHDLIVLGKESATPNVIFGLVIDKVSTLICLAVVSLGFLVILYSTAYLSTGNKEHPHEGTTRYYALLLVFIGAMAGLVLSSTIVGQLLFFEITGGCSWALIGYYQKPKSLRSAMKALIITHIAALGLFIAAAWLYKDTGSFALSGLAKLGDSAKIIIIGGILFAAWGKSAQTPMHMWLPDAMEAPTPISSYLHAASMVKVGVYIFARAVMSADGVPIIVGQVGMVMAVITLLYGFLQYLPQTDMKRLLAYSTITQLSYMFFAISLAIIVSDNTDLFQTVLLFGAIAYVFNHAYAKSLFFLVAGAFSYTCGTRTLTLLKGVIKKLPLLGIGFCIAALAITGVPPFNGFFSKFPIFVTGFSLGLEHWFLLILLVLVLLESIGSFVWFLYWFGKVVLGEPSNEINEASTVPCAMKIVIILLIIMSLCSSFIAILWLS